MPAEAWARLFVPMVMAWRSPDDVQFAPMAMAPVPEATELTPAASDAVPDATQAGPTVSALSVLSNVKASSAPGTPPSLNWTALFDPAGGTGGMAMVATPSPPSLALTPA